MEALKYQNKKLLILGSNVGAEDLVKYARRYGAYTIAADYYPPERSAAKRAANEHVLISTADLDALCALVREREVDGVLAGISEFNLQQAMHLSERCGLPFVFTDRQWKMIEEKHIFRTLCEMYDVPCPKTFFIGSKLQSDTLAGIHYPVVIKPVDASTSAGVSICWNEQELLAAEESACAASSCGEIIVEEYVSGVEFTAHYSISGGEAALACIDNRYPAALHSGSVTTIPVGRVYPSLFLEAYERDVDPAMRRLICGIGVHSGILFIQGLYDAQTGAFHVFEAGLRSAGEAPFRFISRVIGINAIQLLVDHVLSVPCDYDLALEDPTLKGKCCAVISFAARGGVVGSIQGLEEAVAATPSVVEYESRYPVGSTVPDGDTLRQIMIRFVMICDNREQLAQDIAYLNEHITVLNDQGENMVVRFDPERVFDTK